MSGYDTNITLNNSPSYSSSNGGYLQFNGTNTYGTSTYTPLYDFLDAKFSIAIWVYCNTGSANLSTIMCNRATYGTNERSFEFYFSSTAANVPYIWFGTYNSGWTYVNDPTQTNVSYNQWYHVVATSDGVGNGKVYINGVLKQTNSSFNTSITQTTVPLQIGAYYGGSGGGAYFNGRIANLELYNRDLSINEVLQNFNVQRNKFGI
jgi:hypothetical protein